MKIFLLSLIILLNHSASTKINQDQEIGEYQLQDCEDCNITISLECEQSQEKEDQPSQKHDLEEDQHELEEMELFFPEFIEGQSFQCYYNDYQRFECYQQEVYVGDESVCGSLDQVCFNFDEDGNKIAWYVDENIQTEGHSCWGLPVSFWKTTSTDTCTGMTFLTFIQNDDTQDGYYYNVCLASLCDGEDYHSEYYSYLNEEGNTLSLDIYESESYFSMCGSQYIYEDIYTQSYNQCQLIQEEWESMTETLSLGSEEGYEYYEIDYINDEDWYSYICDVDYNCVEGNLSPSDQLIQSWRDTSIPNKIWDAQLD